MLDSSDTVAKSAEVDVRAAVTEIYEAHFEDARRWLASLGMREADRDDAVHETFLVVYRKYAGFEGRSKLTTWLFSICMRVASDHRRRAHVRRERGGDAMPEMVDPRSLPDDAASESQARDIMFKALEELDAAKHAVFVLYEIEGLSAPEIAELMNCSHKTIYTRLYAARRHFREAVARLTGLEQP
jgi:RNA polymerase sigma-70 factor (ECF subfamily)